MPLKAYEENAFKLYTVDIGLMSAMVNLDASILQDGDKAFQEFKGALTEQYVCQQLIKNKEIRLAYWSAG